MKKPGLYMNECADVFLVHPGGAVEFFYWGRWNLSALPSAWNGKYEHDKLLWSFT